LSLARVARQVLCANRRFYEPIPCSDESNPALDSRRPTAPAFADRDADHFVAGAAVGEAGLLERVACGHGRGRELAAVPFRYQPSLIL
jgi:hypothetical protein